MKKILVISVMFLSLLFMVSCGSDDDETCVQNEDCASGFFCDQSLGKCIPDRSDGSDENSENAETGTSEGENPDGSAADGTIPDDDADHNSGGIYVTCTPGEHNECYEGPSGTVNVGLCKAGYKECVEDGSDWSIGSVKP